MTLHEGRGASLKGQERGCSKGGGFERDGASTEGGASERNVLSEAPPSTFDLRPLPWRHTTNPSPPSTLNPASKTPFDAPLRSPPSKSFGSPTSTLPLHPLPPALPRRPRTIPLGEGGGGVSWSLGVSWESWGRREEGGEKGGGSSGVSGLRGVSGGVYQKGAGPKGALKRKGGARRVGRASKGGASEGNVLSEVDLRPPLSLSSRATPPVPPLLRSHLPFEAAYNIRIRRREGFGWRRGFGRGERGGFGRERAERSPLVRPSTFELPLPFPGATPPILLPFNFEALLLRSPLSLRSPSLPAEGGGGHGSFSQVFLDLLLNSLDWNFDYASRSGSALVAPVLCCAIGVNHFVFASK